MLPEIVPGSIDVQAPSQLGIPVEGYEGFDEDASYQLMEEITKDLMRHIYVPEVLNWWVNEQQQNPAFSTRKLMLSGRRAIVTPSNRSKGMVGNSCKRLKGHMPTNHSDIESF